MNYTLITKLKTGDTFYVKHKDSKVSKHMVDAIRVHIYADGDSRTQYINGPHMFDERSIFLCAEGAFESDLE